MIDEATDRPHEPAETEDVSLDGSSEPSDVSKLAVAIPSGCDGSVGIMTISPLSKQITSCQKLRQATSSKRQRSSFRFR